MEVHKFLKTPENGNIVKVYFGVEGKHGCSYGKVKGLIDKKFIRKGVEQLIECVYIEDIDYEPKINDIDYFLDENRVINVTGI